VLVLQILLGAIGIGDGADDLDADAADFDDVDDGGLNVLSIRAITGFLTFFGLVGWAGTNSGWPVYLTAIAAFAAGLSVMLLVAWVMRMFRRLTTHGNLEPKAAIGQTATVYLRIPGQRSGKGKVTVSIQGRSVEYLAVTKGPEIATGQPCRLVGMETDDTFEVEPLE